MSQKEVPKQDLSIEERRRLTWRRIAPGHELGAETDAQALKNPRWTSPVPRPLFYCLMLYAGSAVLYVPLTLWRIGPRAVARAARGQIGPATLAAAVSLAGYGLILKALETAPVSYVVAARQTSVIFALGLAVIWLGERPGRTRVLGGIATCAGVALITLS